MEIPTGAGFSQGSRVFPGEPGFIITFSSAQFIVFYATQI